MTDYAAMTEAAWRTNGMSADDAARATAPMIRPPAAATMADVATVAGMTPWHGADDATAIAATMWSSAMMR